MRRHFISPRSLGVSDSAEELDQVGADRGATVQQERGEVREQE